MALRTKRNNVKVLTPEETAELKSMYSFSVDGKYIIVTCTGKNRRTTPHIITDQFSILAPCRRITFWREAISAWIESGFKYNLLDVQRGASIIHKLDVAPTYEAIIAWCEAFAGTENEQ